MPEEIERAPIFSRKRPRKMSARNRPRKAERQLSRGKGGTQEACKETPGKRKSGEK
jgi:hypothetical protein